MSSFRLVALVLFAVSPALRAAPLFSTYQPVVDSMVYNDFGGHGLYDPSGFEDLSQIITNIGLNDESFLGW
jgi:hypothetical protein